MISNREQPEPTPGQLMAMACIEGEPDNSESIGLSPEYDRDSVPEALLSRHALGERSWARLRVLSGSVTFVNLRDGREVAIEPGKSGVVPPALLPRVELGDNARFQLEFFRDTE